MTSFCAKYVTSQSRAVPLVFLFFMTSLEISSARDSGHGVMVDDVHIEYHPGSSLSGTLMSGAIGSFPGGYSSSDWSRDWSVPVGSVGGRLNVARCVDIPSNMSLCRSIGYHQMMIPNLLNHDSVSETTQQAASWVPLLNIRCHSDTQMFLCSLFAPVCLDRPIFPCRTLCQAVKAGCEARMLKYGFPWPEMLQCDKFPVDNDLCIGLQNDQHASDLDMVCPACNQPDTFENIIDNFCQADFVLRARINQTSISIDADEIRLIASKKKIFKQGSLKPREMRGMMTFHIVEGAHCQCNSVVLPGQPQQQQQQTRAASTGQSSRGGRHTPPGYYLMMGTRSSERLVLSFIQPINRRSSTQSRALSSMKHDRICRTVPISPLQPDLASGSNSAKKTSSSSGGRRHKTTTTTMLPVTIEKKSKKQNSEKIRKNNGDKKSKNRNSADRVQIDDDDVIQPTTPQSTSSTQTTTMASRSPGRRKLTTPSKIERRMKGSRSRATPNDYS